VAIPDGVRKWRGPTVANHYTIDINQFTDTLNPSLPPTTLWGYNPRTALGVPGVPTQKHLGGIIVTQRGKPVQITFVNNLPNSHILPVDTTIMGADGAQNRVVTHLHGGFVPWISDGGPFAWWDPNSGKGASFKNNTVLRPGQVVPNNQAEFYYPNNSSARFQWYHDHALGITRLNAYAGIATGYIIRDNYESLVLVKLMGLPAFVENGGRELPLVIQDKIFMPADDPNFPGSAKTAGSLWYPYVYDPNRWALNPGGLTLPASSVVPEAFGDTLLVNGTAYPSATVDPRRYRLRILNACNARFLNLQLYEADANGLPIFANPGPPFLVIGAEGGFLAKPVSVPSAQLNITTDPNTGDRSVDPANPGGALITAPAERWDVVVDFNGKAGKTYVLWNDAPAPFPGGSALNDYPATGAAGDTQTLMRFVVVSGAGDSTKFRITPTLTMAGDRSSGIDRPLAGTDPNAVASTLSWLTTTTAALPVPTRAGVTVRYVTLNEGFDAYGRLIQMQGNNVATSVDANVADFSRAYDSDATETMAKGATEVWHIVNLTMDTHPIHIHLATAQILSRRPFDVAAFQNTALGGTALPSYDANQPARGPEATELGWKETFKANPGEVTTIIAKFDLPTVPFVVPVSPRTGGNEYVWHCHILDHEEHDMMRPLIVSNP
jgi:spore coat protein A